jgi:hypothetical protein
VRTYPIRRGTRVALLFAACTLLMVGPHAWPLTRVSWLAYEPKDSAVFVWNFWWTQRCLARLADPYWTDLLFHPYGASLAFHSYSFTYSLLSLPVQWALPGPEGRVVALNLVILLSFFLSGAGAYRLAAYATGSRRAAVVAGLGYTFVPYHFANMVSLHLVCLELLPFYVLALLRLAVRPERARAAALAMWLGLAYYTSLEYGLYLALFSVLWLLAGLALGWKKLTARFLAHATLAAVGFGLLTGPLLLRQVRELAARDTGQVERRIDEVRVWGPALAALFAPSRLHAVWGEHLAGLGDYRDGRGENWGMRSEASLSLLGLLLAAFALRRRPWGARAHWALGAATFAVLGLGPYLRLTGEWTTDVPLPYLGLYELVPFFRPGRDSTRLLPMAMLLLWVTAAFGIRDLLQRVSPGRRTALAAVLAGLVLLECLPAGHDRWEPRVAAVYGELAADPGEFAILDLSSEYDRLLGQTRHGKKITRVPRMVPRANAGPMSRVEADLWEPGPVLALPAAERALRVAADRAELRALGVRYAVLPDEPLTRARVLLARELGARMRVVEDRILCAFE